MKDEIDDLYNNSKMLETQIAQIVSTSSRVPGKFPGHPEANPVEHCNVVTLRSGKILQEPRKATDDLRKEDCTSDK